MARKLLIGALALAIGAGVARAQGSSPTDQMTPPPRAEKDRAATAQAEGVYDEARLRAVTMTVKKVEAKKHKATVEIQVSPEANITAEGKPIKLDQLKEGDQLRASFDPTSGDVVRVEVMQKARSELMVPVLAFLRAYNQRKKLNPSLKLAAGVSGSRSVV